MAQIALQRAVDAAGGQSALAAKLSIRQSLIWYWLHRAKKGVAPEWCPAIEQHTGVPAYELRPDIFAAPAHPVLPHASSDAADNAAGARQRHVKSGAAPAHEAAR